MSKDWKLVIWLILLIILVFWMQITLVLIERVEEQKRADELQELYLKYCKKEGEEISLVWTSVDSMVTKFKKKCCPWLEGISNIKSWNWKNTYTYAICKKRK